MTAPYYKAPSGGFLRARRRNVRNVLKNKASEELFQLPYVWPLLLIVPEQFGSHLNLNLA